MSDLFEARVEADALEAATSERDAALAAIERVRDEHQPCYTCIEPHCFICKDAKCPCPTIRALYGAPEPDWEREYRRVRPDGVPVFNAVFESLPVLDDYYTAEYRTVSQWLPVEGESNGV